MGFPIHGPDGPLPKTNSILFLSILYTDILDEKIAENQKPQKNLPSDVLQISSEAYCTDSTELLAQVQIPLQSTPKNAIFYNYEYGGFGYSAKMQEYINWLQWQAQEAEREAESAMRDADAMIEEAIRQEEQAMLEEAAATVVSTEVVERKNGKKKKDIITIYYYADGSSSEEVRTVKNKHAKQAANEARVKSQQLVGQSREKAAQAQQKKTEAERRASDARAQADNARGQAEEAKGKAAQAKDTARKAQEKAQATIKTTTEKRIQIVKTKNEDGSTTVILTDRITGARRELRFDTFGSMTYKLAKDVPDFFVIVRYDRISVACLRERTGR